MYQKIRKIFFFTLSVVLGLILVLVGIQKNKYILAQSPLDISNETLVILVDNSGSMGRCSSEPQTQSKCVPKIEVSKDVVRQKLAEADLKSSKIGLVELGNWKSYGLDYQNRCKAVKPLVLPSIGGRNQVIDALKNIQANDDGVTPIGFAINAVVHDILKKYNLLPANIILVSDGDPNCEKEYKINLCDIIAGLAGRGVALHLHIIGYETNGKDNEFTSCAKKYPGMVHYWGSANNRKELEDKIDKVLSPLPVATPIIIPPQQEVLPPLSVATPTTIPIIEPDKRISWECRLKSLGIGLLFIFCALCISLVFAIIVALFLPNTNSWVIKYLIPSDPVRLTLIIGAIAALATLAGSWATALTAIPCNGS